MSDIDTETSDIMSVEEEAAMSGWKPLDQWKGDPAKHISAEEYIATTRTVMPILRKTNQQLVAEMAKLKQQSHSTYEELAATRRQMAEIQTALNEQRKAQDTRQRQEILLALKAAKSEGDIDAEVQAMAALSRFDNQPAPAPVQVIPQAPVPKEATDPDIIAWTAENSWFNTDEVKGAAMVAAHTAIRARNPGLSYKETLAMAKIEIGMDTPKPRATSKVDYGSSTGSPGTGGTSFRSLSSEEKEACHIQAPYVVGDGKRFKTLGEWETHYANTLKGKGK